MKYFLFFILSIISLSCRKDSDLCMLPEYNYLIDEWNLIKSEVIYHNSYYNSYDTTISYPNNIKVEFLACYQYVAKKNDTTVVNRKGDFEPYGKPPNFSFKFELNGVDYFQYPYLPSTTASSPYFKVNQDTLWAKGNFIFYYKYSVPGGTAYINKKISHVFVR